MMIERPTTSLKYATPSGSQLVPVVPSPPATPVDDQHSASIMDPNDTLPITLYDFSMLDYQLEKARVIGTGLWSTVCLAETHSTREPSLLTPPSSPPVQRAMASARLVAVKIPTATGAKDVFQQEAKILTCLMRRESAVEHVVGFHGLDPRNGALVLEAVIGGSLEHLNNRLRHLTEMERHLKLVKIFPGIARDLIGGLAFLHAAGVVHADIKPSNVLLDISDHHSQQELVYRARYIDFSASFRPACGDTTEYAGGTWDYMAPEQMVVTQQDTVTPASDVWALGITLLTLIIGASPYTETCGASNRFRLREAVKSGDPLGFARSDHTTQQRMAACQDNVDCCRHALQKDRGRRPSAMMWKKWFTSQEM